MNVFIPRDKLMGKNRGFVMFASRKEADIAMSMANGRSWGGQKNINPSGEVWS